jgi:phosphopantothenoylcysteine decarboxylase / phosphopantothenate---cysteine ligase
MNTDLKNKNLILGVTGSIAAYKAPMLVREFVKAGINVRTVITPSAQNFVTKTVLSNLSGNPVICEMFDDELQNQGAWHIQLAHWCDIMLIAPCTATTLARIATGLCNTSLTTLALALPKETPLIISPAMDSTMWEHPATQKNISTLKEFGAIIIPPEEGELSSGLKGKGRLPDFDIIFQVTIDTIKKKSKNKTADISINHRGNPADDNSIEKTENNIPDEADIKFLGDIKDSIKGKSILITAGPTQEKIDAVRYISNFSTGKMGYAIATEAVRAGAKVTLISGPVTLPTPEGVNRIDVKSASKMYEIVLQQFNKCDIAILSAAVADYTPEKAHKEKIKKEKKGDVFNLKLKSTDDILHTLGLQKKPGQKLVGFALETTDGISNGWKKLKNKNCNMIVVNYADRPQSGFAGDDNTITLLLRNGSQLSFEPMSKKSCAQEILKKLKDI